MPNPLSGPFQGDVKPAPGPKSGANEMQGPDCSPATFSGPFQHGRFEYHKGSQVVGVTTQVDLPHGPAKEDSPFHGDFRPGVNSSKK